MTSQSSPQPPPQDAAPVEPLRVGIVGVLSSRVRYGSTLLSLPSANITVMIDPDIRLARSWARQLGAKPEFFPSFSEFLASDIPLDAMVLPIPMIFRQGYIRGCSERGIAMLCEAPYGYSLKTNAEMLEFASTHNALLAPVFPRQHDPYFQEVGRLLASNLVGALKQVRCEWSIPLGEAAVLENGVDDVDEDLLVQNLLCQSVDLARAWFGEAYSVSADVTPLRPENRTAKARNPVEEPIAILIVSHENVQVTHVVSRTRSALPGERYTFTGMQGQLEFIARAGVHHSSANAPALYHHHNGQSELLPIDTLFPEMTDQRAFSLLAHFLGCVRGEETPQAGAESVSLAMDTVHGAYISTLESSKVMLPLHRAPDFEVFFRRFETIRQLTT